MLYNNIKLEFSTYLNRYCEGIIQFRNKLKKVSLFFELSDSFSNHACRLYIDVDFFDIRAMTKNERKDIDKFFYNNENAKGSKFVSFIYQSQRDSRIDVEEVETFIYHYQFSQNIFEGLIRNILPEQCSLEIESLETEPFFNYFDNFLMHSRYSKKIRELSFRKEYFNITKSEFKFDRSYHNHLMKASMKELDNTISDKELCEGNGCNIMDIRSFVLREGIPFSVGYSTNVIENINIDAAKLKEKMKLFTPEPYSSIRPNLIIDLIEKKEQRLTQKNQMLNAKCSDLGIQIGDYLYVQDRYNNKSFFNGMIKEIRLSYNNELEIRYNTLKKDLSENKLPLKTAEEKDILYFLKSKIFQEEKNNGLFLSKENLIRLFKNKGIKNVKFKKIK